ncbi:hypothetical protein D3C72_1765480 [compost metagenome]
MLLALQEGANIRASETKWQVFFKKTRKRLFCHLSMSYASSAGPEPLEARLFVTTMSIRQPTGACREAVTRPLPARCHPGRGAAMAQRRRPGRKRSRARRHGEGDCLHRGRSRRNQRQAHAGPARDGGDGPGAAARIRPRCAEAVRLSQPPAAHRPRPDHLPALHRGPDD